MNFFKMLNERRGRRKEMAELQLLETAEQAERRERIMKEICKTCAFGKVVVLKDERFDGSAYDTEEVVCMLNAPCEHYVEKKEKATHGITV